MANIRDRRVIRTKKNIYDALFSLMEEKNYAKITVTDLAERADINRKTFYVYYTGVDDLLEHIENELYEKYAPIFRGIDVVSSEFDVYSFFQGLSDMIEKDMQVLQLLSRSGKLLGLEERTKKLLVEIFQEQLIKERESQELRLYLEYAAAGILSMLSEWIQNPKSSLEDFTTFLAKVTLGSFRAIQS